VTAGEKILMFAFLAMAALSVALFQALEKLQHDVQTECRE
jgi:hypothetical protein